MSEVVDLQKAKLAMAVRRAFRNWRSQFQEAFGPDTRCAGLSDKTLTLLVHGKDKSTFYLFDLIMTLDNLGSGFEFNELNPKEKMAVMDRYLFLLDRLRYEYMKRLGWLSDYPGEEKTLVDLILHFDESAPELQARTPMLSSDHPAYEKFCSMNTFEREECVRKLIPEALKGLQNHSTTL